MAKRPLFTKVALLSIALLLSIAPGSAADTILNEGEFPEWGIDDPIPLSVWNVPLKLILLDFVFMNAPLLFLPVQILIVASAWAFLGHRKISGKNALNHETRRAAYLYIRANPGTTLSVLSPRLGVNAGTLRYHLEVLCETGKIHSEHDRGFLRYYASRRAALERETAEHPHYGTRKRILDLLVEEPGMTRKEIASTLGIAGSSVTWHMARLIRDGAVRSERDGRAVRYFLAARTC